jgi:hypothetical protein
MLVPEDRRLAVTAEIFGRWFPTRIEPLVLSHTERRSRDYKGGYRYFYTEQRWILLGTFHRQNFPCHFGLTTTAADDPRLVTR